MEVTPIQVFGIRKLESLFYSAYRLCYPTFSRFDTTVTRDRQTDGLTDGWIDGHIIYHTSIVSCVKI